MSDLLELPQFSKRENCGTCGRSTNQDRVPQFSPYPPPEGGGMDRELWNRGGRRGSCPENRGDTAEPVGLWERRRQLEADLAECLGELKDAEAGAERTEAAFDAAQERLLRLTRQGRHNYPTVLRPAYEAWRITSREHYPFKLAVRELHAWHQSILDELRQINAEIDKPKATRFSQKRTAENRGELLL